jgi:hypothetical protein
MRRERARTWSETTQFEAGLPCVGGAPAVRNTGGPLGCPVSGPRTGDSRASADRTTVVFYVWGINEWIIFAIKSRLSRNSPRAQDVATRFMLKTGGLGRDWLERFSHLQKERREPRFEFRTSQFLFFLCRIRCALAHAGAQRIFCARLVKRPQLEPPPVSPG